MICPDPTANCGRAWLSTGLLAAFALLAWAMQLQVVIDVGLVGFGISASFSFIRSLGATFFVEDDYMFLKPNKLFDV